MSAYQRNKGARFERLVASTMAEATGLDIHRTGGQSRKGTDAPDVEAPGVWLECKVGARPDALRALAQGERDTDGRPVVAVCKRDRYPASATMRLRTAAVLWGVDTVGTRDDGPVVGMLFDEFLRLWAGVYGEQVGAVPMAKAGGK